jgi:hypothetical protein
MATLSKDVQTYIVQQLACFATPSEVAVSVAEHFGVTIDRRQVRKYNPQQVRVAEKWQQIFVATRKAFLEDAGAHAVAHQAFRLRELLDLYRRAKKQGNTKLAADLLRQAAEEVGGSFTNRRELSGHGGSPVPSPVVVYVPDNQRSGAALQGSE